MIWRSDLPRHLLSYLAISAIVVAAAWAFVAPAVTFEPVELGRPGIGIQGGDQ